MGQLPNPKLPVLGDPQVQIETHLEGIAARSQSSFESSVAFLCCCSLPPTVTIYLAIQLPIAISCVV
jgi:hypothetical protein